LFSVLGARIDSPWIACSVSLVLGAFVSMMSGAFPPGSVRNADAWTIAFLLAPSSALVATYPLRRAPGAVDTLSGALGAGALAAGVMMVPMGVLLTRILDEASGLAKMGMLYLDNDNFAAMASRTSITRSPRILRTRDATVFGAVGLFRMNEVEGAAAHWEGHGTRAHTIRSRISTAASSCSGEARCQTRLARLALAKNPKFDRARRYLAVAYERQGDPERAFEHYDRAIALAPEGFESACGSWRGVSSSR
jgi:hypothetical protein